ncbi:MAG: Rrf2 family transcriptional regulator [Treponema sp.]|jgi:Rrf2 family protein|nr:Rrf2 family transcriptional regulator [Treponema sp.]
MRISAKGRYALAAMTHMATHYDSGENLTVISIAERLGTSKIYLEQIFSLLKKDGLLNSVKGAQGGYQLSRMPRQITAAAILSAVELSLFEETKSTMSNNAPEIDKAIRSVVFNELDSSIKDVLVNITLETLVAAVERHKADDKMMFYI